MEKLFDITKFESYKEDNRREVKKAYGGLPNDMWETYSAYANTYGGVIILGVKELDDKHWKTTGLKVEDKEKRLDDLWNLLHNPQKVNVNLLTEKDVETFQVGEDIIIVIYVPMENVTRNQCILTMICLMERFVELTLEIINVLDYRLKQCFVIRLRTL